jgi:hypothetical protein
MTIYKTRRRSNASSSRKLAGFTMLASTLTLSPGRLAHAGDVTPPPVPQAIQVPQGSKAFLKGHAVGTQNYVCTPSSSSPSGVAYALFTPQATLYSDDREEVTTHYFSANPAENNSNPALLSRGVIRATWRHSGDASTVWGEVKPGNASSDPAFVKQGAIGWVLLTAAGTEEGPTGGDTLTRTAFIQRVNTSGGAAPATGCASMADVGNQAWVPYTADYFSFTRP